MNAQQYYNHFDNKIIPYLMRIQVAVGLLILWKIEILSLIASTLPKALKKNIKNKLIFFFNYCQLVFLHSQLLATLSEICTGSDKSLEPSARNIIRARAKTNSNYTSSGLASGKTYKNIGLYKQAQTMLVCLPKNNKCSN